MADITDILPQPRRVRLAGQDYEVSELTFADVARIQAWLNRASPCPMDDARDRIDGLDGPERRKILLETYQALKSWPPRYGDPEASELLQTEGGAAEFLFVALSRHQPDFTRDDAMVMAPLLTASEWEELSRALVNPDPMAEVVRLIFGPERNGRDRGREDDWEDGCPWTLAVDAIRQATGWTYEEIGRLTLTQSVLVHRKGCRPGPAVPVEPGESLTEIVRRRRQMFGITD
jgi:hypothetical protein